VIRRSAVDLDDQRPANHAGWRDVVRQFTQAATGVGREPGGNWLAGTQRFPGGPCRGMAADIAARGGRPRGALPRNPGNGLCPEFMMPTVSHRRGRRGSAEIRRQRSFRWAWCHPVGPVSTGRCPSQHGSASGRPKPPLRRELFPAPIAISADPRRGRLFAELGALRGFSRSPLCPLHGQARRGRRGEARQMSLSSAGNEGHRRASTGAHQHCASSAVEIGCARRRRPTSGCPKDIGVFGEGPTRVAGSPKAASVAAGPSLKRPRRGRGFRRPGTAG